MSAKKKSPPESTPSFAVLGAGHGGLAMAGHLALMGFPTRLWNRSQEKIDHVEDRRSIMGPRVNQTKLALRRAFADLLPKNVMNRRKQRFSDGAGSITALVDVTEKLISDDEFERERRELPRNRIRTKEELLYYRAFKKWFDSESAFKAVGFTPRP